MAFAGDVGWHQNLPFGSVDLIIGSHTHDLINKSGLDSKNVVNGIPITKRVAMDVIWSEVDIVLRDAPTVANVCLNETVDCQWTSPLMKNGVQQLIERSSVQNLKKTGQSNG